MQRTRQTKMKLIFNMKTWYSLSRRLCIFFAIIFVFAFVFFSKMTFNSQTILMKYIYIYFLRRHRLVLDLFSMHSEIQCLSYSLCPSSNHSVCCVSVFFFTPYLQRSYLSFFFVVAFFFFARNKYHVSGNKLTRLKQHRKRRS